MALKILKRNTNQCNVCKKQFINLKSFRKHLRTHIEDRPFKCKLCPRGFTEENYLNNHMRTHMPDEQKPHECKICKKRFIHATLLNKHLLKHTGEKPFVCKICNKGCYAENSLLKHMKIHLKKEGDPGLLKHICDYCKVEYPDAQSLDIHIKQHTGDRPFLCKMCGKSFPQRFNLELHLRTHTGNQCRNPKSKKIFICGVCYRRTAFYLRDLQERVRFQGESEDTHAHAHERAAVRVRLLRQGVQAVRRFDESQTTSWHREAYRMLGLSETVSLANNSIFFGTPCMWVKVAEYETSPNMSPLSIIVCVCAI